MKLLAKHNPSAKEAKMMVKYEYLNAWANISELLYYATHEE